MSSVRQPRRSVRLVSLFALLALLVPLLGFYNPPLASAGTASVTANVHLCPYDLSGLDVYSIAPLCTSQASGNPVTLDNGSGIVQTLNTDASGLVTFSVDPGSSTFYLYPSLVSPYVGEMAGCSEKDNVGNDVTAYSLMQIGGLGDVHFFFGAQTNMWYCDFFLYDPTVPPPPPTTYGSVTVNKITCPDGFDGYSADIYGLAQNCQDVSQVVTFALTDSSGATTNATTPGSGVNLATWQNIPSGAITLVETPIQGYGEPRVFCKNSKTTAGEEDPEAEVGVSDTTATTELKGGYDFLYCHTVQHLVHRAEGQHHHHQAHVPGWLLLVGSQQSLLQLQRAVRSLHLQTRWRFVRKPRRSNHRRCHSWRGAVDRYGPRHLVHRGIPRFQLRRTSRLLPIDHPGRQQRQFKRSAARRNPGRWLPHHLTIDAGYDLSCDWFNSTSFSICRPSHSTSTGCPDDLRDQNWTLNDFYQYCQTSSCRARSSRPAVRIPSRTPSP